MLLSIAEGRPHQAIATSEGLTFFSGFSFVASQRSLTLAHLNTLYDGGALSFQRRRDQVDIPLHGKTIQLILLCQPGRAEKELFSDDSANGFIARQLITRDDLLPPFHIPSGNEAAAYKRTLDNYTSHQYEVRMRQDTSAEVSRADPIAWGSNKQHITISRDAESLWTADHLEYTELAKEMEQDGKLLGASCYGRRAENAIRVAGVFAAYEHYRAHRSVADIVLTQRHYEMGRGVVSDFFAETMRMAKVSLQGPKNKDLGRILDRLRDAIEKKEERYFNGFGTRIKVKAEVPEGMSWAVMTQKITGIGTDLEYRKELFDLGVQEGYWRPAPHKRARTPVNPYLPSLWAEQEKERHVNPV